MVLEATLQLVKPRTPTLQVTVASFPWEEGLQALVTAASREEEQGHDFIDAISFPNGKLAVIMGDFRAEEDTRTSTRLHVNSSSLWFYEQIQDRLKFHEKALFTMSLYDYLFRYDYGAFWMARPLEFSWNALWKEPQLAGPFLMASRPLRRIVGGLYSTASLYRVMHQLHPIAVAERFVIMDAYMPSLEAAAEYLSFLQTAVPTSTPIWLCPVLPPKQRQPLSPSGMSLRGKDQVLVNVALWGRVSDNRGIEYVAAMEARILLALVAPFLSLFLL